MSSFWRIYFFKDGSSTFRIGFYNRTSDSTTVKDSSYSLSYAPVHEYYEPFGISGDELHAIGYETITGSGYKVHDWVFNRSGDYLRDDTLLFDSVIPGKPRSVDFRGGGMVVSGVINDSWFIRANITNLALCYRDADSDSYSNNSNSNYFFGSCPSGWLNSPSNDCDDSNASINPGATEICGNGVDEDCDGSDAICCPDNDNDGYNDLSCGGSDCDDSDDCLHPGQQWYKDADDDHFYVGPVSSCSRPSVNHYLWNPSCSSHSFYRDFSQPSSSMNVAPTDCDDSDASLNWKCCLSGEELLYKDMSYDGHLMGSYCEGRGACVDREFPSASCSDFTNEEICLMNGCSASLINTGAADNPDLVFSECVGGSFCGSAGDITECGRMMCEWEHSNVTEEPVESCIADPSSSCSDLSSDEQSCVDNGCTPQFSDVFEDCVGEEVSCEEFGEDMCGSVSGCSAVTSSSGISEPTFDYCEGVVECGSVDRDSCEVYGCTAKYQFDSCSGSPDCSSYSEGECEGFALCQWDAGDIRSGCYAFEDESCTRYDSCTWVDDDVTDGDMPFDTVGAMYDSDKGYYFHRVDEIAKCGSDPSQCVIEGYNPSVASEPDGNYSNTVAEFEFHSKIIDNTTVCVDGEWQDCDVGESVCEGMCGEDWARAGLPLRNESPSSDYYMESSEYSGFAVSECCGDDPGEVLTTSFCDADTKGEAVCCPNSSYASFNGQCVLESKCPDILRGAPVWQPLSNSGEGYITALDQSLGDDGYCCHESLPGGPLCSGSVGCYLSSGTAPEVLDPFSEYCADDECVLPLCQDDVSFSLCEQSEVVTERSLDVRFDQSLNGSFLCDGYDVDTVETSCYPTFDTSSCDDLDSQCDVVNVTVCEPTDPDECVVLCEDERESSTCTEVCEAGFECETVQTLRGPCECASPAGEVCGTERVVKDLTQDSCSPAVKCTSYGCTLNSSACSCDSSGCDPSCGGFSFEDRFTRDVTVCGDSLSCNASVSRFSAENVKCVGDTTKGSLSGYSFPLLINSSTDLSGVDAAGESSLLQCSDKGGNITQGDGLCPDGFDYVHYLSSVDVCEKQLAVCDFGSPGNLDNGCDNLTTGSDYWGLYNKDCVFNTSSSVPPHVYDDACCYDTSVNSLDIYQNDEADTVRVY